MSDTALVELDLVVTADVLVFPAPVPLNEPRASSCQWIPRLDVLRYPFLFVS